MHNLHLMLVPLVGWIGMSQSTVGDDLRFKEQVRQVVYDMKRTPNAAYAARLKLQDLPTEYVVPVILDALADDPAFEKGELRLEAYGVLVDKRAGQVPAAIDQLLSCLREPEASGLCAAALGWSPPGRRKEVAKALASLLDSERLHSAHTANVVISLGKLGPASVPYLDRIRRVFSNPKEAEALRSHAAAALLRIGGLESLGLDSEIDPVGKRMLLIPLARFAAETETTFNTDDADIRALGDRLLLESILSVLKSDRTKDRRIALDAVYGGMGIIAYAQTDDKQRELAAQVVTEIQKLALGDSEQSLRNYASDLLLSLDKALAIARRQPRPGLKPQSE